MVLASGEGEGLLHLRWSPVHISQYDELLAQWCYCCFVFSLWAPDCVTSPLPFPISICASNYFCTYNRTFYLVYKNILFKLWLYFPKVTLISILVLQCAHRLSSLVVLANIIITHLVLSPISLNILNSVRPKMATIYHDSESLAGTFSSFASTQ